MSRSNKFDYQTAIRNCLFAHPDGLTLDVLLERSGLKVDRSTLFRHLTHLIENGHAERMGKARASRYRSLDPTRTVPDSQPPAPDAWRPALSPVPVSVDTLPAYATPLSSPHEARQLHQTGAVEPGCVSAQTPDYEAVVRKAVRTIVRDWKRFSRVNLEIYLSLLVKPDLVDEIATTVEQTLAGLRGDNPDRFGLTQADFTRFNMSAGVEPSRE